MMIFVRRPELKVDFFFALVCICAAGASFSEIFALRAVNADAFIPAFRLQITFEGVLWITLIWFIAFYTGTARRVLAIAATIAYALAVIVNIVSPYGVVYAGIEKFYQITLPWGEVLSYASGPANPWRFIADIGWVLLIYIACESCVRLARKGEKRRALFLGISLFVFLGLGYLYGTLMDLEIVGPPALRNFSFFGLVLIMSGSLAGEVVRASVLTRKSKDEKERMDVILSTLNTGLALINPDLTVQWVNAKTQEILPWDELVGKICYEAAAKRDEPCEGCGALLAFADGKIHETERQSPVDGKWHQIISLPIKDTHGRVVQVLESVTDITNRKEAEIGRDQAMNELEEIKSRLEEENIYLKTEIQEERFFSKIIGKSNALLYVLTRVNEVAETDATVLIQGETGVGKELVARAVHDAGSRSGKPFVKVNCAAIPPNLVESELFGHERGAFTGADRLRRGRFELADGGTIFLDEISEMPPDIQAKLLRVLQDGEFERVGGDKTLKGDTRVVAATNRILTEEVAAGRFRADLYYRLNVYPLSIPPLRKRREDIPLLVEHFTPQIASRIGKHIDQVPTHVMDRLMAYHWPGNVRELRNVLERAVITSPGSVLQLLPGFELESPKISQDGPEEDWYSLEEAERRHILKALERTNGKVEGPGGAAELLELKPSTLRFRIKKLGIKK
ncbi:MAG: sigma 54-interacting transcriptional regulator [Deltaproteobacteria bacterium]|nr:sigma 54-interacting transcriptional regulator [Deltaproteobacteria bacterium]